MSIRTAVTIGFGAARLAFGAYALGAPEKLGSSWIGKRQASKKETVVILRALGVRDVTLGAGTMIAAAGGSARLWLAVSAAADIGDMSVTLASRDDLPEQGVRGTVALTAGAAIAATVLAALDRPTITAPEGP